MSQEGVRVGGGRNVISGAVWRLTAGGVSGECVRALKG